MGVEDWERFAASAYIDFGVIETAIARYSPALVDAIADSARPMDLDAHQQAFAARFTDLLADHPSWIIGR